MLVTVVCALLVGASLALLAAAGLGLWRRTVALGRAVGRAGEMVAEATSGLEDGLGELHRAVPGAAAGAPSPAGRGEDAARLAARVRADGARRGR